MNIEQIIQKFNNKFPNIKLEIISEYINFCFKNSEKEYIKGSTARHHILPMASDCFPEFKSLKQNLWNQVILSHKNHYIAHSKLALMGIRSQIYAWYAMNNKDFKLQKIDNPKIIIGAENYDELMKLREQEVKKPMSLESRKKLSESRKANPCNNSYKGENNGMFGKHLSKEAKEKISMNSKKYWQNMSKEKYNELMKIKSKNVSGEKNPMYGHRYTDEEKIIISQKTRKYIESLTEQERKEKFGHSRYGIDNPMAKKIHISYNGECWDIYGTLQKFCIEHNISYIGILNILKGWKPTKRSKLYGWQAKEIK